MCDARTSIGELEWTINGYTLAFGVLLVTGGRLGGIFGRRLMFMTGVTIFSITSATAGLAASPEMLVGSRVVQGVGAALMMPATLSIITNPFPPSERGKAIGTWAGVSPWRCPSDPSSGILQMSRMIGGAVGVAATGAIFQAKLGAFDPAALATGGDAARADFVNALASAMEVAAFVAAVGALIAVATIRGRSAQHPATPEAQAAEQHAAA